MYYTDSHIHLLSEAALQRARERNVRRFFCNATGPDNWEAVSLFAQKFEGIVPFFGLHPWYVEKYPDEHNWIAKLEQQIELWPQTQSQPCGIGEIGLDRHVATNVKLEKLREKALRLQLRIAKRWNLPVSIHCVRAMRQIVPILNEEGPFPAILFHAFSGPYENKRLLDQMNVFFSFSGAIFSERQVRVQKAAREVPANRILLETDAPNPIRFCEKNNEPALIPEIGRKLADLRDTPEKEMIEIVLENDRNWFK